MASAYTLDTLQEITQQLNLYVNLFICFIGIFGQLLNIIVFSTLKTFRETTCSIYLITTSIANIGVLIVLFLRVLFDGIGGIFVYTPSLCKLRFFISASCAIVSLISMCFATINQFISMTKYKQWCNPRIARHVLLVVSICSILYNIPALIYFDTYLSSCIISNTIYNTYYTYFHVLILIYFLPLSIIMIFVMLAFHRIHLIAKSRQIHIIRLSCDRQLTIMTLFHACFILIASIPFVVFFIYSLNVQSKEPMVIVRNRFIYTVLVFFNYINYSVRKN